MARNEIFFVSGNALMVTSVEETNASLRIGKPEQLFSGDDLGVALDPVKISGNFAGRLYDVSPDGQWFVVIRTVREAVRTMTVVENSSKEFEGRE